MIGDFFSWLFAVFVVDPIGAEVALRLDEAKAPVAVVSQVNDCLQTTGSALLDWAGKDAWWAVGTTISVTTGQIGLAELLDAANPACGAIATYLTASADN
ncbi:hypothetical protein [Rhizobium glycinendophyticum]|uniref:Uncharacterized protein n=1 Tax=Rhizobium glycinendophyticum TaxID=2589807 RepID=A0A504V2M9_9HYPH|nr:hypothetical protein [Rhizobium glycinendophyticum]TPP11533.1 hypothetical protein FJQ55_12225 [Rhizobium glycinendophyticum]